MGTQEDAELLEEGWRQNKEDFLQAVECTHELLKEFEEMGLKQRSRYRRFPYSSYLPPYRRVPRSGYRAGPAFVLHDKRCNKRDPRR